jgi:hypothetical protein
MRFVVGKLEPRHFPRVVGPDEEIHRIVLKPSPERFPGMLPGADNFMEHFLSQGSKRAA